jgi:predicted NBD/HSP70 family sugar kinase
MINILNPDRIVQGGMHADLLAAEEDRLRTGIRRHSFLQQAAQIELRPAELASSALAGAAELALQPLLDDPRMSA